jgi:xanthine/CO dehydrogenase XdhC/CoxF family maturation factor
MTEDMLRMLIQCQEKEERMALVTIISTLGSTPCKAGTKMLVFSDGRTYGTIGGGCSEAEARIKALTVLDHGQPCIVSISLLGDQAADIGMVCGGTMDVFIQTV